MNKTAETGEKRMETEGKQRGIEQTALKKVRATLETCVCLCSGDCKRGALEGLRDQIVKLFDEAINAMTKRGLNDE